MATATPTKPLSARDLLALAALPLDASPEVQPLAAAAEAAERTYADLLVKDRRYRSFTDPNIARSLERSPEAKEVLDAAANAPTVIELARARAARDVATERLDLAVRVNGSGGCGCCTSSGRPRCGCWPPTTPSS